MARFYDSSFGFAPYVTSAARKRVAEAALKRLRKKGRPIAPVEIAGRKITTTFWGSAWCDNLERYSDFENRLPRGRTYVRNGSVIHLEIAPGQVEALVSGSEVYEVRVKVAPVKPARWRAICRQSAGRIDSLVELLQGTFSRGVMEHLCRQGEGLFPTPRDIQFSCSCPDVAWMCKHVAAVLYGVGARLDHQPELLFRLRQVDEQDLLARATGADLPLGRKAPRAGRVLPEENLSDVFGLDLGPPAPEPAATTTHAARRRKKAAGPR